MAISGCFNILFFNGSERLSKTLIKTVLSVNKNIKIFETYQKFVKLDKLKKNAKYLVFSGIGTPSNFKFLLLKNNIKIFKFFEFPDHHNFKKKEIIKIKHFAKKNNLKILTTEKDYLRLSEELQSGINFTKINLEILQIEKLKKKVIELV